MKTPYTIPTIPLAEQTVTVKLLLGTIEHQQIMLAKQEEQIELLKEEIKHLKGHKGKPKIKPSQMNIETKQGSRGKRPGSIKRQKTENLEIHEERKIVVNHLPDGSIFKGYQDYVSQDLILKTYNILYRLERWKLPDGTYRTASLPEDIRGIILVLFCEALLTISTINNMSRSPLYWINYGLLGLIFQRAN